MAVQAKPEVSDSETQTSEYLSNCTLNLALHNNVEGMIMKLLFFKTMLTSDASVGFF